jgi:hypothetical protein
LAGHQLFGRPSQDSIVTPSLKDHAARSDGALPDFAAGCSGPLAIALLRNTVKIGIFSLNLFLGWTFFGWQLYSLVWAGTATVKSQATVVRDVWREEEQPRRRSLRQYINSFDPAYHD